MITKALTRDFAHHLEVVPSSAGLHIAAVAPKASAAQIGAVARRASEAGVEVQELSRFAVDGPALAGLVLGYGAIPTARIEEGLGRLRSAFAAS
jgi:GntR family transcriptional regulator / MocR family aminotransferase